MTEEKPKTKRMTLDRLAEIVAKGFEHTASKEELKTLVSKDEFHTRMEKIERRLASVELKVDEVKDLVINLDEGEILDLQRRVQTLERSAKNLGK